MFRIRKIEKGWIVERKKTFLFFSLWVSYIDYSGLPTKAFPFESYNRAMINLQDKVAKETHKNSA